MSSPKPPPTAAVERLTACPRAQRIRDPKPEAMEILKFLSHDLGCSAVGPQDKTKVDLPELIEDCKSLSR